MSGGPKRFEIALPFPGEHRGFVEQVAGRFNVDRLAAGGRHPISWLHLSDFHFKALERWERRKTLQALLRHVENLRDNGLRPDFVFVTGDVAFSGQRKEYDQAVLFFAKLAETLELEPRERFFFVPGNHDVDRGAIGAGDRRILKGVDSQDDVEDLFGDPEASASSRRRAAPPSPSAIATPPPPSTARCVS